MTSCKGEAIFHVVSHGRVIAKYGGPGKLGRGHQRKDGLFFSSFPLLEPRTQRIVNINPTMSHQHVMLIYIKSNDVTG